MRRKSDTLERLFAAAVDLIAERGYAGTTVDAIVERAGIAKGTVYYHFKSKAELMDALVTDGLERLAACFRNEVEGAQSPQEALRALVHAELAYIQRYQSFSKLVMSEMWRADQDWQPRLRVLRDNYGSVFAAVLAEGVEAGVFRAGLDPQAAASTIFGMIATAALDWLVFTPERPLEKVEQEAVALVLGAVGARA